MKKINLKREAVLWSVILVPFLYTIYSWSAMPDRIPVHFDIHGEVNGWGGKAMILLMPVLNIVTYLLLLFLPQIDPKKMSEEFFNTNFYKIRVAIAIFQSVVAIALTYIAVTHDTGGIVVRLIPISGLILISVIGNFMINVKPNWIIGVRTPWTLSSDHVWKQTHLVLGRVWFFGGLIGVVLALVVGLKWLSVVMVAFAVISTVIAVVYSFVLYRQEQREKAGQ